MLNASLITSTLPFPFPFLFSSNHTLSLYLSLFTSMDTPHSPSSCSSSSSSSTYSWEPHAADTINLEPEEPQTPLAVRRALQLLKSGLPELRLQAARDIRKLTKTSQRCRRQLSESVGPLVDMLRVDSDESHEPALLALLNLAVKDEK